jgi:hypothetical protein
MEMSTFAGNVHTFQAVLTIIQQGNQAAGRSGTVEKGTRITFWHAS